MLTPSDLALLGQLQAAYDSLISGAGIARVSYNGTETDFAKADLPRLESRIAALQARNTPEPARTRGAVRFRL